MKYTIYIISLLLLLPSCKKDVLVGQDKVFVGKWTWVKTRHAYGWCDGLSLLEILTPESEGYILSIEFYEKGIVKYLKNGEVIGRDRIIFNANSGGDCDYLENPAAQWLHRCAIFVKLSNFNLCY